jgi:hypothetical protein
MHFHIVKMYKDKEVKNVNNFFVNVWRKNIFDIYVTEYDVWKIYDFKIEVVPLIINFSTGLTTVVKFEVPVQKWCGLSCIGGLFNFQLCCAPLLADLFLHSYESEFLQKLVKDKKIHEARAFNFTYRYIDDVLSINNSRFAEFLLRDRIRRNFS